MLKCVKGKNEKKWSATVVKFRSAVSVFSTVLLALTSQLSKVSFLSF